jgi:thiol-disulfide isomerase/thioredoxin
MAMIPALPLRLAVIAAALLAGASLALWSGYEYGPRLFPHGAPGHAAGAAGGFAESFFAPQVLDNRPLMPALAFVGRGGHPLTLADFRGRVVLLNLWATWCVPCREEMPALDRLQQQLGGKDFVVVPLSIDHAGAPAVERFYQKLGLKRLGVYVDPSARISNSLALPGLPTSFLVDAEGREIARKIGPAKWDGGDMVALIRRYLPPEHRQRAMP